MDKLNEIDRKINEAKARKARRLAAEGTTEVAAEPKAPKAPKAPREPKTPKVSDEEKQSRLAAKEQERLARKAVREAKKAEQMVGKAPAHMRKVMKAAEKLSPLAQASMLLFNQATASLTATELSTLALHIQQFNRVKATERAISQKLETGSEVTIVGGDQRFIGMTGTVTKVQRIRAYVTVEGFKKPLYLFTSDCEPVTSQSSAPVAQTA